MDEYVKIHNFKDSQKIEEEGFERQNDFYLKQFGHLPHRVSYVKYQDIQKSDRDLFIENKEGKILSISEKNRTKDFNDILFEIYSDYSRSKLGWGIDSEADILAYFLPSSIVILDMQKIVGILSDPENKMTKQVEDIGEGKKYRDIWINGVFYPVTIVKALNKGYFSLSITLKDEQLTNLGVRFKRF